jgi:hypothetical protein
MKMKEIEEAMHAVARRWMVDGGWMVVDGMA